MNSHGADVDTAEINEESARLPVAAGARVSHPSPSEGLVEYDGPALVELTLDETDYRIDVGKAGTAVCISTRAHGRYDWQFQGEARWDGRRLRCRAFDFEVLERLASALAERSADDS
jgi:hypothetical protein